MKWLDYNIESFPDGSFAIQGEWPGEVMGVGKDGEQRNHYLYKPGDVFVVRKNGILKKLEDVEAFVRAGKEA